MLILSNPPHEEINAALAAPYFSLSPAEVRMKANYPIPEIWLTDNNGKDIESAAHILRTAGLNVVVVDGNDLVRIPERQTASAFVFTDTGMTVHLENSQMDLSHDGKFIAVFCQPRTASGGGGRSADALTEGLRQRRSGVFMARDSLVGFGSSGRGSSAGAEEEPAESPFLDVYVPGAGTDGGPLRLAVVQTQTDFSGLGDLKLPRPGDNMVMFVAELESRFTAAQFDRRLVDMQPRSRAMVSQRTSTSPLRKGFSFATAELSQLLESLSPDLKDVSQFELASRLAYLTRR